MRMHRPPRRTAARRPRRARRHSRHRLRRRRGDGAGGRRDSTLRGVRRRRRRLQHDLPGDLHAARGPCGLTTDVTATGEFHAIVRTTTGDDGRTLAIGFNNSAHGTAVGADGTRYVWNYHNNRRRVNYTGTAPFEAHQTDHFHLIGRGGAPDIHTFFNIYFTVEVDGSRTYVRQVTIGDPERCDPI
jgi:hypothetical protein